MKRFDHLSACTEIDIAPTDEFRIYIEYLHQFRKQGVWQQQPEYGFFNLSTGDMESCSDKPEWALQDAVPADPDTHYPAYFTKHICPNLQNGPYREYNMPVPLLLIPRMVAHASGNRKKVKRILKKHITALGKKRAYGYGRITGIDCEQTPEDRSLVKDGRAMRWLPDSNGIRQVRPAPPYWNMIGRVHCCEIGDEVQP